MYLAHISNDPFTTSQRRQTCAEHSRATAALAKAALSSVGLASAGELAGLLHDCGKFTDEFNGYLEKASRDEKTVKGSVIHSFAGAAYLLQRFHSRDGSLPLADLASEVMAASISSHHGLIDLWNERHQNGFDHRLTHQPAYDARAVAAFHAECADERETDALYPKAEQEILSFFQQKISTCISDNEEAHFAISLLVRLLTSAVVDGDRTDTRCFMQDLPLPQTAAFSWADCAAQINAHVRAFPQRTPIQRARGAFSDHCAHAAKRKPGLYRLDLPTGGGKTLAALRFAILHAQEHGMRRIFYIAPLLSILEQNADVIREAVEDTLPVLEHHSNILREDLTAEEASQAELLQETWDAPMIVTTFVQFLDTLFSGKMASVRRFHMLCNSVIILDEVQSLPPKMLSLFNCAVNFLTKCCGATVILCSATQPAFIKAQHPMLPCERLISEEIFNQYALLFRRTEIIDGGTYSMTELASAAANMLEDVASLLIVCNTKREASELYACLEDMTDARLFHLSAGMCMAHRKAVLNKLLSALESQERLICVSTQVIEAGVDLSFQSVIRLSAGLDNIVQAAGRCNRHGENDAPQPVRICRLKEEKLGPLREIRAAQDALNALLAEYRLSPARYEHDLTSDAAVREYYGFLYKDMHQGAQDYPTHGHTLFELLSTNHQFAPEAAPRYYLNQAFRTAGEWFEVFDSSNESILVPHEEGADLIEQLNSERARRDMSFIAALLAQAKPYTVSVTMNQVEKMMKTGMVYTLLDGGIYVLNNGYYDAHTGIKEGNESCSTLIL